MVGTFLQLVWIVSGFSVLGLHGICHLQAVCPQVAALANACGVGGGAFFVPMFNILLGFSKFASHTAASSAMASFNMYQT